ncbi:MAG: FAD-dependent oxidoreductase [Bdellovibrionota bacterium]
MTQHNSDINSGTKKVDVLVLGAGIVGVSVARELQSKGRKVTLIDKVNPGLGCSYGNAGWITPCFAMPLPQPGMFWKSMKWMLDPESPLYIKPQPSMILFQWLFHFMKNMNGKKMNQSIDVLTEISKDSLNFYSKLNERNPQKFDFQNKGLLMVSGTPSGVQAAHEELDLMATRGIAGKKMSAEEIVNFEPSLRPEMIKGGVYFTGEAHAEPLDTVKTILKEFEDLGGYTQGNTEVYDFEFEGNKIKKVLTTRGTFEADLVVFALGSWSEGIGKKLNTSIPIMGGKGYSLIVKDTSLTPGTKPLHPIMIIERKIAVTPRKDSVRLAGTLELVKIDFAITTRRVNAIIKGSKEYLKLPPQFEIEELWRGLRPCTPDGVPIIGFSKKWSNLFYCTGHQMLGLQSAPGSARLAGELIYGEKPYVDPKPFEADRF